MICAALFLLTASSPTVGPVHVYSTSGKSRIQAANFIPVSDLDADYRDRSRPHILVVQFRVRGKITAANQWGTNGAPVFYQSQCRTFHFNETWDGLTPDSFTFVDDGAGGTLVSCEVDTVTERIAREGSIMVLLKGTATIGGTVDQEETSLVATAYPPDCPQPADTGPGVIVPITLVPERAPNLDGFLADHKSSFQANTKFPNQDSEWSNGLPQFFVNYTSSTAVPGINWVPTEGKFVSKHNDPKVEFNVREAKANGTAVKIYAVVVSERHGVAGRDFSTVQYSGVIRDVSK